MTWVQLGLADAPCILANVAGYFDPLVALIDGAHARGFVSALNRALVETCDTIDDVARRLAAAAAAR